MTPPPPALGESDQAKATNLKMILGTIVVVVGLVAYVVLALNAWRLGQDAATVRGAVIILVTPIATTLLVSGATEPLLSAINRKQSSVQQDVTKIKTQTNGDSFSITKAAVHSALVDHEKEHNNHG